MAKAFVPKVSFKCIDLAEYGGEGTLFVKGLTTGVTAEITDTMQQMAIKDGYSLGEIQNKKAEIDARYNIPMILLTIRLCTTIDDDDGRRPLTEEEVADLPMPLAMDIYSTIMEMNGFPLAQRSGEESRQEQSRPTDVA